MAGDRKQFRNALALWDVLRENNQTSVPDDEGMVAILCSGAVLKKIGEKPYRRGIKDVRAFYKEGIRIAERFEAAERKTVVIANAQESDFVDILRDREVSTIVTIGHGALYMLFLNDAFGSMSYIDWRDISSHADHLKTGQFVQRHCGGLDRRLSVPLGTFCVTDHSNVIAPVGVGFEPRGLDHPYNDLLTPITDSGRMTYQEALSSFTYAPEE